MEHLMDAFQWLVDFFGTDGENSFWVQMQAHFVIWMLEVKIALIQNGWQVASAVMDQLNITSFINDTFDGLDSGISAFFTTLRIPDVVNILVQAHITRLALNFLS